MLEYGFFMRRHVAPILGFFLTILCNHSQAQLLSWGHSIGSTGSDYTSSLSIDGAGNVYTSAGFVDTIDADPGPAVLQMISKGGMDGCISKLDAAGNLLWAFSIGGPGHIEVKVMSTSSGDLIVAGIFNDTIDLDPGIDSLKLGDNAVGAFVARYTSTGQLISGKKIIPAASAINMTDIATDAAGNLYFTGVFIGSAVDFDPGAGTYLLGNGANYADFILKLDAAGNFEWARAKTSTGDGWSMAWSIAVDATGNVYNTGMFHGTVDLNSSAGVMNVTSNGYFDAYLTKLDAAGNFVWTNRIGSGAGQEYGFGVTIDAANNIFTTGFFEQTNDFDPGAGVVQLTAGANADGFITKHNTTGGILWVKALVGQTASSSIIPRDISLDGQSNIYTVGYFLGTADFDPADVTSNHLSSTPSAFNCFISKLNSNGHFVWAGMVEGASTEGNYLQTDACGNIYMTGSFRQTADIEPAQNINLITSAGSADHFFLKLSQSYWTGNVSTDWFDPLNWACNTVPGIRSNVIIPTGAIRFPILTAPAEVKSIELQPAASMQVEPGVQFKVNSGN